MLPPVAELKRIALDLLFPQWCVGCGREGSYICESCRESLTPVAPPFCPRCGRPQADGALCPLCVSGNVAIDGIRSPYLYGGVIRRAVHELKYRNLRALAMPLAGLLHEYLQENPLPGDVLVPIPLHPKRLRERGYNQSARLAGELGKLTGLPVAGKALVRERATPSQARTDSLEERRQNIAGAFTCNSHELRNRQIILIDDVATSGATLNAAAAALKEAGAASVWGLVVAIEP